MKTREQYKELIEEAEKKKRELEAQLQAHYEATRDLEQEQYDALLWRELREGTQIAAAALPEEIQRYMGRHAARAAKVDRKPFNWPSATSTLGWGLVETSAHGDVLTLLGRAAGVVGRRGRAWCGLRDREPEGDADDQQEQAG